LDSNITRLAVLTDSHFAGSMILRETRFCVSPGLRFWRGSPGLFTLTKEGQAQEKVRLDSAGLALGIRTVVWQLSSVSASGLGFRLVVRLFLHLRLSVFICGSKVPRPLPLNPTRAFEVS
jgi:hypothetical protein